MKKLITLVALLCISAPSFTARAEDAKPETTTPAKEGKAKWFTSITAARKEAAEKKLPIIMLFTGSDWCPWCIKLEKEILSKKEFKTWAPSHAVLYIGDYTRSKPMTDKAGNDKLMKQYGASGYPTIIVSDAAGKKLGQTGYQKLTPAQYTKHLEGVIAGK